MLKLYLIIITNSIWEAIQVGFWCRFVAILPTLFLSPITYAGRQQVDLGMHGPGLSKRFRVAGDAKKVRGGPAKHGTHLSPITASIILILFFTTGRHDFLFSTCMNFVSLYHGNLQYWIWHGKSFIISIMTHSNLIHFKLRFLFLPFKFISKFTIGFTYFSVMCLHCLKLSYKHIK